jgi:uncharacterized NAD(P)/FAD-binding protein YdhS
MSAWADDPNHFAARFETEGGNRRGFAPRRLFGRYLGDILEDAVASGCTNVVHASATAATRGDDGWQVELAQSACIQSRAVALAIGNQEPEPLRAFAAAGERFIANPWGAEARAAVEELAGTGGDALIVGTGLTMVDLVLSLDAAGHRGRIVALSRRGLVPRGHADFEPAPIEPDEVPVGRVRSIWRWLRRRTAERGWRAAVDSLRPHSHRLWQSLSAEEQRRFLRHARPWWDVHRHRIAPEVAATVERLIAEGRLRIMAGRVTAARTLGERLEIGARPRGGRGEERMMVDYAFNCTGPLHSIEHTRDPLLRSLLDSGEVRADHLGMGLDVDGVSRAGERLWALGPLTKGRYWEIIAVPDIREQAAAVAADIARELNE